MRTVGTWFSLDLVLGGIPPPPYSSPLYTPPPERLNMALRVELPSPWAERTEI